MRRDLAAGEELEDPRRLEVQLGLQAHGLARERVRVEADREREVARHGEQRVARVDPGAGRLGPSSSAKPRPANASPYGFSLGKVSWHVVQENR